jgi:hypothetical protein
VRYAQLRPSADGIDDVVSRARCSNVRLFAPGGIIASLVPLTIVIWIVSLDACRQRHREKYSLNALTYSAPYQGRCQAVRVRSG